MRLDLNSQRREQMIDITEQVQRSVAAAGIRTGAALIYCPHTTAAITVNEAADPDVAADILAGLSRLAPHQVGWRHAEGNSDAHLKSSLVGASELVPVSEGRLALGTWQGVFLCEFDGPRRRTVNVIVTEASDS